MPEIPLKQLKFRIVLVNHLLKTQEEQKNLNIYLSKCT